MTLTKLPFHLYKKPRQWNICSPCEIEKWTTEYMQLNAGLAKELLAYVEELYVMRARSVWTTTT